MGAAGDQEVSDECVFVCVCVVGEVGRVTVVCVCVLVAWVYGVVCV